MEVVFTIRRTDAAQSVRQIQANRGREGKRDVLHLLVSEYAVTLRSVGTECECPVQGACPGVAQLPLRIFASIVDTQTAEAIVLRITNGAIFWGKSGVRNPSIAVGSVPNLRVSVPVDARPFDLLMVERVAGMDAIVDLGLTARLQEAHIGLPVALERAAVHLAPYGINRESLERLLDEIMRDAEPGARVSILT